MEYTPPFSIELFEVGTWFEIANRPTFEQAMRTASAYAELHGDKRIKVTDANGREL